MPPLQELETSWTDFFGFVLSSATGSAHFEYNALWWSEPRSLKVYYDFDILHYGHANSLRQAKLMGDILVVGIHNDEEIQANKGVHVMTNDERCYMLRSMRFADEIVENAIFCPTLKSLEENRCDFATHGDDLTITSSGFDVYAQVKNANKLKLFKRTDGISTTAIIDRILYPDRVFTPHPFPNMPLVKLFEQQMNSAKKEDKIVYIASSFDLFNPNHVTFIKKAYALGDYLIAGIHSDRSVETLTGRKPLMSFYERALMLMSCKYVSLVVEAEVCISREFMECHAINLVVQLGDSFCSHMHIDPYSIPKAMNKFQMVSNDDTKVNTFDIIQRVLDNRDVFEHRNEGKHQRESCG